MLPSLHLKHMYWKKKSDPVLSAIWKIWKPSLKWKTKKKQARSIASDNRYFIQFSKSTIVVQKNSTCIVHTQWTGTESIFSGSKTVSCFPKSIIWTSSFPSSQYPKFHWPGTVAQKLFYFIFVLLDTAEDCSGSSWELFLAASLFLFSVPVPKPHR